MRNRKLLTFLTLTILSVSLTACGHTDFTVEPIVFEQPEQPAPIEESESTYENASYVLVDDSEEDELVDEEEILKELGCYVAKTEEEAVANKGTSTSSSASTSTSSASVSTSTGTSSSTPNMPPKNPNDTFVYNGDGFTEYVDAETGRKYTIDDDGWVIYVHEKKGYAEGWK